MNSVRWRYVVAVLLATSGLAFGIALVLGWFLDPPWSLLGIGLSSGLGWWSGRTVLTNVLRVGREEER